MNWGTKLMIGMGVFMAFIIGLGLLMINSKNDALVDTDYYEKGINYDQEYQKKENVKTDHATPGIIVNNSHITLTFMKPASGTVSMIRTSDKRLDRSVPFKTNKRYQVEIPVKDFTKGRWKIKLEWQSGGKFYLYEREVNL